MFLTVASAPISLKPVSGQSPGATPRIRQHNTPIHQFLASYS